MLTIAIDRTSSESVYEQVARQIRQLVASGALAPGTALPSVRQLARDLGVSLNTVARAYRRLGEEGFLDTRDRVGVRVAAPAEAIDGEARTELLEQMKALLARLRQAGMDTEELLQVMLSEVGAIGGGPPGGPR